MQKANAMCPVNIDLKDEVRVIIVYNPATRTTLVYSDDIGLQAVMNLLQLTVNSMGVKYGV